MSPDLRIDGAAAGVGPARILFVLVGLPAFILTTTTPLSRAGSRPRRIRAAMAIPYWLYALSNGGSLLALLAYPLAHRAAARPG